MQSKKAELDELKSLSEKDLWCRDLDEFIAAWNARLTEEQEITKKIRGLGRRVSKKIGAGKGSKMQSRLRLDDDYAPKAPKVSKANPAKGVVRVEPQKSSQKFLSTFGAMPKPKPKPAPKSDSFGTDGAGEASGMSDDDFAAVAATTTSKTPADQPAGGRSKRAAAAKPKNWVVENESDSDDDKLLGDVGDMVKGIKTGSTDTATTNGRLSLFAMSRGASDSGARPTSSGGLVKGKSKNRIADNSDNDETNYEMLAQPSPHKPGPSASTNLDSFLSNDDDDLAFSLPPVVKKAPASKPAPRPVKAVVSKKSASSASLAQPLKTTTLSPAAKAYALKQTKLKLKPKTKKALLSDDDDDNDIDMADDSPPPKPAARRPARAAAVVKAKKPIYVDDDSMDVEDESALVDQDDSDDFEESD
jgi:DNA topoisomerase II